MDWHFWLLYVWSGHWMGVFFARAASNTARTNGVSPDTWAAIMYALTLTTWPIFVPIMVMVSPPRVRGS